MMNYNTEKTIIDLSDAVNMSDLGIKITSILDSNAYSNKELCLNLGSIDLKQSQLLSIKALVEAMQSKLCGIETTSEMTETSAIGLGLTVGKPSVQTSAYQAYEENEPEATSFRDSFKTQAEETVEVQPEPTSFESAFKAESAFNSNELSSFEQLKNRNSVDDFVTNSENSDEVKSEKIEEETQEFSNNVEESQEEVEEVAPTFTIDSGISAPSSVETALDVTFGTNEKTFDNDLLEKDENDVIFPKQMFNEEFEEYESTETTERADDGKYVLLDTEGITPEGLELMKSNTSDLQTLYLTQTLRSGQTVSFEGNIFLIGDAHPGSEINATGDITVWGILGGIVHAGTKGNTEAKVRALKLNPIQLRIAHLYSRRNDTVNVPYVQKSNEFTPEEARIEREQIVIYKTLRRED